MNHEIKVYIDATIQPKRFNYLFNTTIEHNINTKYGILFVDDYQSADLILFVVNSRVSLNDITELQSEMLSSGIPVILLERVDSSILWTRNFAKIKTLIGIFKNRVMRKALYNNMPTYRLRVHYQSIMDHIKDITEPETNKMDD